MKKGNKNVESIGERIAHLRTKKNITQQEMATALFVDRVTVSQWEQGTRDIKSGNIISIAEYFGVSTDYLLGLSEVKTPNADIQTAINITGLEETALNVLSDMPKFKWNDTGAERCGATIEYREAINLLLSDEYGKQALRLIYSYFFAEMSIEQNTTLFTTKVNIDGFRIFEHGSAFVEDTLRKAFLVCIEGMLVKMKEKREISHEA
ncbi:MAG: helix-turn-helix domain-containing protein [Ruminococcus sp.]|jgi:transcriptional regulator with XRE-family HTH domain|nr:helix-turn-helix domain-containing protein [Ruminococcus sp.]